MNKSLSFRLLWLFGIVTISLIVWLYFGHIPQSPARDNFLGNLLATIIGILVGIPIAMEINEYQMKIQRESEQIEESNERGKRQKRILNLIKGELEYNRALLSFVVGKQQTNPTIISFNGLKNDLWNSFSDGGELQWIDDLELLDALANAYYFIRSLISLEEKYFEPDFLLGMSVSGSDNEPPRRTYMGERIVERATTIRPAALGSVNDALTKIETYLSKDELAVDARARHNISATSPTQ